MVCFRKSYTFLRSMYNLTQVKSLMTVMWILFNNLFKKTFVYQQNHPSSNSRYPCLKVVHVWHHINCIHFVLLQSNLNMLNVDVQMCRKYSNENDVKTKSCYARKLFFLQLGLLLAARTHSLENYKMMSILWLNWLLNSNIPV
jgi:hypothetical protein